MLDQLACIQMLDVRFRTADGRTLILTRYTEPNTDQKPLVKQLTQARRAVQAATANHRAGGDANARRAQPV